ncbi:hypothetical protein ACWCYZ_44055 [Streptomyces virginiae]
MAERHSGRLRGRDAQDLAPPREARSRARRPRCPQPEWVAANAANPLRDWDGLEHIPRTAHRKAIAQYKATRDAFLAEVTGGEDHGTIVEIGRAFGAGFNALDSRTPFIETVEREELFNALDFLADEAQTAAGRALTAARAALIEGANSSRDW